MGFLDFLIKDRGKQTTQESTTQQQQRTTTGTVAEAGTQTQTGTVTGTAEQQTQQSQTIQALSPEVVAGLEDAFSRLTGAVGGTALPDEFVNALSTLAGGGEAALGRAFETEGSLTSNIDAIIAAARQEGVNQIQQTGTRLAQTAGSDLNSIVQGLVGREAGELETKLAGVQGALGIEARKTGSQDIATALQALTGAVGAGGQIALAGQALPVSQITDVATVLRGAVQQISGETTSFGRTTEERLLQSVTELIREIQEESSATASGTVSGVTRKESQPSLLSTISSFLS